MNRAVLDDGWPTVWSRRALSLTVYSLVVVVVFVGLPLWLAIGLVVDLAAAAASRRRRARRWIATRILLFCATYLGCTAIALVRALAVWIELRVRGDRDGRFLQRNFAIQVWIGRTLMHAGLRLFGARLEVEGAEVLHPGPILLFIRHASLGDTMLAFALVSERYRLMLRYVIKRQLIWDPTFDILGNRLPNRFARRGSSRSEDEIEAVAQLAENLGPMDGVLIYPEGTRFSPAKREQMIASLERRGLALEASWARSLHHVLLPKRGGPLALLATNARSPRPADVVFCAHAGFEGSATLADLWAGRMLDQTVRIQFWRVPFECIPTDPDAQMAWLYQEWRRVDAWVAGHGETDRAGIRTAP